MVTEKTQALLTALRELVEWNAERAIDEAAIESIKRLESRAHAADLLTDIMDRLLAANAMARRPEVSGEQEAMDHEFCDSLN